MATVKNINGGAGTFTVMGNIQAFAGPNGGGFLFGDGGFITNIAGGGGGSNYSNANVLQYLSVYPGNIIPSGNNQTLGNATNPWKTLYVSGNTIVIGTANLTTANSNLFVNNNQVITANASSNSNVTISGNLQANSITALQGITTYGNLTIASPASLINATSVTANVLVLNASNINAGNNINALGNIRSNSFVIANEFFGVSAIIQGGNLTVANVVSGNSNIGGFINAGNLGLTGNLAANGGVFSGNVYVSSNANLANSSATVFTNFLAVGEIYNPLWSPGGITNTIRFNSANLAGVGEPVNASDAATKAYVDQYASGLQVKASCLLASTFNDILDWSATYDNGANGVGATLTLSVPGASIAMDGVDLSGVPSNSRVLIKNYDTAPQNAYNGIYSVGNTSGVSNAIVLTRTTDMDTSVEFPSAYTLIKDGDTQMGSGWVCTNPIPTPPVIGTTAITFVEFTATNVYYAGNGLSEINNVFSLNIDSNLFAFGGINGNTLSANSNGNLSIGNIFLTGNITMPPNDALGDINNVNTLDASNIQIANILAVSQSVNDIQLGNITITGNSVPNSAGIISGVYTPDVANSHDAVNMQTLASYSGYTINTPQGPLPAPENQAGTNIPISVPGMVRFDQNYFYVCISDVGTPVWNRISWSNANSSPW